MLPTLAWVLHAQSSQLGPVLVLNQNLHQSCPCPTGHPRHSLGCAALDCYVATRCTCVPNCRGLAPLRARSIAISSTVERKPALPQPARYNKRNQRGHTAAAGGKVRLTD